MYMYVCVYTYICEYIYRTTRTASHNFSKVSKVCAQDIDMLYFTKRTDSHKFPKVSDLVVFATQSQYSRGLFRKSSCHKVSKCQCLSIFTSNTLATHTATH